MKLLMATTLLLATLSMYSQNRKQDNTILKNFSFQVKAGPSMVLFEYKRDFGGIINEMRHLPGLSLSAGFSKSLNHRFDVGYEFEYSCFNGFQNNPNFSAAYFGHFKISLMRQEPVIYHTILHNHNFVATYHFDPREKKRIVPFVYAKAGTSRIFSTLMYKEDREIIFSKTGRDETKPNSSIYVDNFNFGIGIGNEIILNKNFSLNIHFDLNMVNDDNLDAVHNFREPPPDGYKNFVSGMYTRVQLSASYIINPDRQRIAVRKFLLKDSFNQKRKKRVMYPWYKK